MYVGPVKPRSGGRPCLSKKSKGSGAQESEMKVIGITGGIGAGKSEILKYLLKNYNAEHIDTDSYANKVKEPGEMCYNEIVRLMGNDVLNEDKRIDHAKMAEKVFADDHLLKKVNDVLHPAVRAAVLERIAYERSRGVLDYLFIEAALLIECGYKSVVDSMWVVTASEDVRRARLKATRGYSDEKITSILSKQLKEEEFLAAADIVIDNSGTLEEAFRQVDEALSVTSGESSSG